MKTSTIVRKWWVLIPLGILLWLAGAIFHPFEPRYDGRRLSAWARDMDWVDAGVTNQPTELEIRQRHEKAAAAIQHISSRALPIALELCKAQDSPYQEKVENWITYQDCGIHIVSAHEKQYEGIIIIRALGPMAKSIIPDLIQLLRHKESAGAAAMALGGIGPDAIPSLLECITDTNEYVRIHAIRALQDMGDQGRPAVPALIRCLKDENHYVRLEAAISLRRIGGDPAVVVPAIVQCLDEETDSFQSTRIIAVLAGFGTNARPAIPELIRIIESNNANIAIHALGALWKIDPETAKPFVEKWKASQTNELVPLVAPGGQKAKQE